LPSVSERTTLGRRAKEGEIDRRNARGEGEVGQEREIRCMEPREGDFPRVDTKVCSKRENKIKEMPRRINDRVKGRERGKTRSGVEIRRVDA